MATNQIKPFATGPGANVVSQNEWEALPALLSGFTAGKASSAQVNKALRQTSFIAAALAEFVSEKSGQDVLDDGDVASFVAKLSSGIATDFLSRKNPFADIKADGAAAVSTALANLGLGEAAKRAVGTGVSQIPDMNSFGNNLAKTGYQKLPGGLIIQWGFTSTGTTGSTVTLPVAFNSWVAGCVGCESGDDTSIKVVSVIPKSLTTIKISGRIVGASTFANTSVRWIVIGY